MTPIELEIGMGRAHFLFERAQAEPEHQIVGIEYKAQWVTQALKKQHREQIYNVTPIHGNAWDIVPKLFGPESLDLIIVNFPDPWWKRRHHKRRVLNDKFMKILLPMMKPGARFFFQSDVKELFDVYDQLLSAYLTKVPCDVNPLGAKSHREKKCEESGLPIYRTLLYKNPHVQATT
ncbi:MAG: tRNA (guanosine(46)-N7)-methyltransferase TrmB [Myxococcota bacterium]